MKTYALQTFVTTSCQENLYSGLNKFSTLHPNWGRLCALPVSVVDVALEVLKGPLDAIENAALVPINLVGSALSICKFKNSCALKDSLLCAERALRATATIPVAIFTAMPNVVLQFSSIIITPETVDSIAYLSFIASSARVISRENQAALYSSLNRLSMSHPNWGRVCAIPVSIADIALDTFSMPLASIEHAARSVIHSIGAVLSLGYKFKNLYTLKDSLGYAQSALNCAVSTPVAIFMAIPKLAFQFSAIVIDPKTVQSINFHKPTYKA